MIPKEIALQLHEVPEDMVKEYAKHLGEKNAFQKLLKAAAVFRHAGATPIFLANKDSSKFCVSSQETFQRTLH